MLAAGLRGWRGLHKPPSAASEMQTQTRGPLSSCGWDGNHRDRPQADPIQADPPVQGEGRARPFWWNKNMCCLHLPELIYFNLNGLFCPSDSIFQPLPSVSSLSNYFHSCIQSSYLNCPTLTCCHQVPSQTTYSKRLGSPQGHFNKLALFHRVAIGTEKTVLL